MSRRINFRFRNMAYVSPAQVRECRAAPSEPLNVATRHREAPTGQKMSRCCLTFSGLRGPPFCGATTVQPNMPESAAGMVNSPHFCLTLEWCCLYYFGQHRRSCSDWQTLFLAVFTHCTFAVAGVVLPTCFLMVLDNRCWFRIVNGVKYLHIDRATVYLDFDSSK